MVSADIYFYKFGWNRYSKAWIGRYSGNYKRSGIYIYMDSENAKHRIHSINTKKYTNELLVDDSEFLLCNANQVYYQ